MQRYGFIIRLRPEKVDEYKRLHREVWPAVLAKITQCNIRNYTIFLREPENLLFSYYEYVGNDIPADMKAMAADPMTRQWWALTDPCQEKLDTAQADEWWAAMEEVFHHD
jgi:L-rhamnose mutarotase